MSAVRRFQTSRVKIERSGPVTVENRDGQFVQSPERSLSRMQAKSPSRTHDGQRISSVLPSMANTDRDSLDGSLDLCRHGRGPSQFCPMCDRSEVGFESASEWLGSIDLRDQPDLDIRETRPKGTRPPR
jgi:hypothetical protein